MYMWVVHSMLWRACGSVDNTGNGGGNGSPSRINRQQQKNRSIQEAGGKNEENINKYPSLLLKCDRTCKHIFSTRFYSYLQSASTSKKEKKKGRIKICWVTQKSDFYGTSYKILSHQNSISETPGLHKATPDFSYTRRVTVCRRHITLSSFFESKWTSSKQRVTDEAKIMMRMNHSKYGLSTTVRQAWRILYHFL